jgi:hypothetical protein
VAFKVLQEQQGKLEQLARELRELQEYKVQLEFLAQLEVKEQQEAREQLELLVRKVAQELRESAQLVLLV